MSEINLIFAFRLQRYDTFAKLSELILFAVVNQGVPKTKKKKKTKNK